MQYNESVNGIENALKNNDFVSAARYFNIYYSLKPSLPVHLTQNTTIIDVIGRIMIGTKASTINIRCRN